MKERGILMSAPMVRADLEGRKTQTRRTRGLDVINKNPDAWRFDGWIRDSYRKADTGKCVWSPVGNRQYDISGGIWVRCPFGEVGDRLWFKETYTDRDKEGDLISPIYRESGLEYIDGNGFLWEPKWKSSMFMPRRLARTVREITGLRVERLQDISEADAIAEGVSGMPYMLTGDVGPWIMESMAQCRYRQLWESINGPGSWNANPWVWVFEFRRVV